MKNKEINYAKDRLKPYVYRIAGVKKHSFYDMLNGKVYQLNTEETIDNIRKNLMEANLIFQSDAVVPHKIEEKLWRLNHNLFIRVIQIGINGKPGTCCWDDGHIVEDGSEVSEAILNRIIDQVKFIPIKKVIILGYRNDISKIEKIIKNIKCHEFELVLNKVSNDERIFIQNISQKKNISIKNKNFEKISDLPISMGHFFYSQVYNPCWGHQIAVDRNGNIKPCLWSEEIIGNVKDYEIKDLIMVGTLDPNWSITKDRIEICKDCELRFFCNDCRTSSQKKYGNNLSKPLYCTYDPFSSELK